MLKIYLIDMRQDQALAQLLWAGENLQTHNKCLRLVIYGLRCGAAEGGKHWKVYTQKHGYALQKYERDLDLLLGDTISWLAHSAKKCNSTPPKQKMVAPWGWGSLKGKFKNPSDQSIDITAKLLSYLCPFSNRCVSIPEKSLCIQSPKIQKASAVPLHLTKVPVILTRRKAANVFP